MYQQLTYIRWANETWPNRTLNIDDILINQTQKMPRPSDLNAAGQPKLGNHDVTHKVAEWYLSKCIDHGKLLKHCCTEDYDNAFELKSTNHDGYLNYIQALLWYSELAEKNDAVAQFYLGILYSLAPLTEKNELQANKWFIEAAINGYFKAWRLIIARHKKNFQKFEERRVDVALKLLRASQESEAKFSWALLCYEGVFIKQDQTAAIAIFVNFIDDDTLKTEANFYLGDYWFDKNKAKTFAYLEVANRQGHIKGYDKYMQAWYEVYEHGINVPSNLPQPYLKKPEYPYDHAALLKKIRENKPKLRHVDIERIEEENRKKLLQSCQYLVRDQRIKQRRWELETADRQQYTLAEWEELVRAEALKIIERCTQEINNGRYSAMNFGVDPPSENFYSNFFLLRADARMWLKQFALAIEDYQRALQIDEQSKSNKLGVVPPYRHLRDEGVSYAFYAFIKQKKVKINSEKDKYPPGQHYVFRKKVLQIRSTEIKSKLEYAKQQLQKQPPPVAAKPMPLPLSGSTAAKPPSNRKEAAENNSDFQALIQSHLGQFRGDIKQQLQTLQQLLEQQATALGNLQQAQQLIHNKLGLQNQELRENRQRESAIQQRINQIEQLQQRQTVAPKIIAELAQLRQQQELLMAEYVANKTIVAEQEHMSLHSGLLLCYLRFQSKLNEWFLGYKTLASGALQRSATTAENVLQGINLLGQFITFLPAATGLLAAGSGLATVVGDWQTARKVTHVSELAVGVTKMEALTEKLARAMVLQHETSLIELTDEGARTVGEWAVKPVISFLYLNNEPIKFNETQLIEAMLKAIKGNQPKRSWPAVLAKISNLLEQDTKVALRAGGTYSVQRLLSEGLPSDRLGGRHNSYLQKQLSALEEDQRKAQAAIELAAKTGQIAGGAKVQALETELARLQAQQREEVMRLQAQQNDLEERMKRMALQAQAGPLFGGASGFNLHTRTSSMTSLAAAGNTPMATAASGIANDDAEIVITKTAYIAKKRGELSCRKDEEFFLLQPAQRGYYLVRRVSNNDQGYLPESVLDIID